MRFRNKKIKPFRGAVVRLPHGKRGIVVTTHRGKGEAAVCTHRGDYVNVFTAPISSLTVVGEVQRMPKSCDAEFKHSSIWPDGPRRRGRR